MSASVEAAIVRIRKPTGAIVGAGFLIHEKYVLTCAHVIAQALGISESAPQRPSAPIFLDFPLVAPDVRLTALVVFWRPIPDRGNSTQGHEDIAVLELNDPLPASAKPVRLLLEEDLWNHPFQTFGFPVGHDDGLWSTGILRGRQGTGWVQVEDVKSTGGRLESGYSGAPVWDEQLGGVVGMAVAADLNRADAKIAFIIPTRVIATTWTALAEWTIPPLALSGQKSNRFRAWVLASLLGVFGLGAIALSIPQVRDQLGLGESACFREAEKNQEKAIGLAQFSNESSSNPTNPQLKENISERFKALSLPNVKVCYISDPIAQLDKAEEESARLNASVIIWGRRAGTSLNVYVTSVKVKTLPLSKLPSPTDKSVDFEVQTKDWADLVPVMAAFKLSSIYKAEKRPQDAINILQSVLGQIELRKLDLHNSITKEKVSTAYYELGKLYVPVRDQANCPNPEKCEIAISAYQKAIEKNETNYEALNDQGLLYTALGQLNEAEQAFNKVTNNSIEKRLTTQTGTAQIAIFNRARMYLKQGKMQKAILDLQQFLRQNPREINALRLLGLTQLQAAKTEDAKQTYIRIKQYLGNQKTEQSRVIDDLEALAQKKPALLSTTQKLASMFK